MVKKHTLLQTISFCLIISNLITENNATNQQVFQVTENLDLEPQETSYHRSQLHSEIKLVTWASQTNDEDLIKKALPQCATWASLHHFTRYYISVEPSENGIIFQIFF